VAAARRLGYAVSVGEIMPGTWGLAVPVTSAPSTCAMSVGVIAAQALDEQGTAGLVTEAARELVARVSLSGELH